MSIPNVPHDEKAEREVLGCALLDNGAANLLIGELSPEDFWLSKNRIIYNAIGAVLMNGLSVNLVSVRDELIKSGDLKIIGGFNYLDELIHPIASPEIIQSSLDIVKDRSVSRKIITVSDKMKQDAESVSKTSTEILLEAEETLFSVSRESGERGFVKIGKAYWDTIKELEILHHSDEALAGLPYPINYLNHLTKGMKKQQLIIIGGDTSHGKSAFAQNISLHVARKGYKVAYFSFEMSAIDLTYRWICQIAQVDSIYDDKHTKYSDDDWQKIIKINMEKYGIVIYDDPGINTAKIINKSKRLKKTNGIDLFVFDYLQQIEPTGKFGTRAEAVGHITRELKKLAKMLDLPVIAISQLKRKTTATQPDLHDLRESGSIEQDADVVLFTYLPEKIDDNDSSEQQNAEIILAKQRQGSRNKTIYVGYYGPRYEWRDIDKGKKID